MAGIYQRTDKHKKQAIKNLKTGMLGKHHSEKTKEKIRETALRNGSKPPSNLGKRFSEEHKRKISESRKNKKLSEKTKEKIRTSLIGNKRGLGKKHTEEWRQKMSEIYKGNKSHLWKGGITLENKRIRNSIEFRLWREAVFARDNWICQKYGTRGGKLHPHHINNFADFPEIRFAIDNGITLSKKAHDEFHKKYGKKNNTREQLEEFLGRLS